MDFVDGFTLSMVLRSGRAIPERAACTLMAQLCDGFEAFHRLGLTHRDITPDTIMITQADRQVKLMDFGLVLDSQGLLQLYEQADILDGKDFLDDLDAGLIAGTPEFMAPEQILDPHEKDRLRQKTDTTADVFALGTIFYQLIAGTQLVPYERGARGATGKQALINYLDYRVRFRDDDLVCPPQIGAELWSILRKTLVRDPKMRQRDATELGADMRFYLETGQGVLEDDLSATIAQDFDARHMKSAMVSMSTGEFNTITQAAAEAHKAAMPELTLTGSRGPRPTASKLPATHPQPAPSHVFEPPPLPPPPPPPTPTPAPTPPAPAAEPKRGGAPDAPLAKREPVTAPPNESQNPIVKRAVVANPNLRPASVDSRPGGIAPVADGQRKGPRRALLIGLGVAFVAAGVLLAVLLSGG
jgi:serine/threonine protein kinase